MQLNHLHLHVRDVDASKAFYEQWFGFVPHCQHGPIHFLRDAAGLDLALAPDANPAALPPWFHFGFRLASGDAARRMYADMQAAELPFKSDFFDEPDLVSFRVADPDGYRIEIYWE